MGIPKLKRTNQSHRQSHCTLSSQKACSSVSHFLSKSAIMAMKRKLPIACYYIKNGKIKTDCSIETDICILRRYYRNKLGRFKYSMKAPELRPVKSDHACGDSVPIEKNQKTRHNIDVTTVVVENLKDLLNDWIKKYLLNNKETKQKIETVLDSILHKLELERNSSSCTYTLGPRLKVVGKKPSNSYSAKNEAHKLLACKKQSCQTVPLAGKHVRLISTLSIPRNMKRLVDNDKSQKPRQATHKRYRYKNVFLTLSRSKTLFLNSTFNLLSISTKSFTKRCAIYEGQILENPEKNRDEELLTKSSYNNIAIPNDHLQLKNGFANKINPNLLKVKPIQSLVNSIYTKDPANVISFERQICKRKIDNYTLTDTDSTLKNITPRNQYDNRKKEKLPSKIEHGIENITENRFSKINISSGIYKSNKLKKVSYSCRVGRMRETKPKRRIVPSNLPSSQIKYIKKIHSDRETKFVKDLQNILNTLALYTESKNVQFDIRIKMSPDLDRKIPNRPNNYKSKRNNLRTSNLTAAYSIISKETKPNKKVANNEMNKESIISDPSPDSEPKLISLLDGAVSQSNYVFNKKASSENTIDTGGTEKHEIKLENISAGLKIAKDINELRNIIKDLAATTDKFVEEHMENISKESHNNVNKKTNCSNTVQSKGSIKRSSKAVQFSNDRVNSQIVSGFKFKKEPKKAEIPDVNSNNLVKKKVTSYDTIESELVLKVTDMSSAAGNLNRDKFIDKSLSCSLTKSRTQFNTSADENSKRLLTYYCDELTKSNNFTHKHNLITFPSNGYKERICPHSIEDTCQLIDNCQNMNGCQDVQICIEPPQHALFDDDDDDCAICGTRYSCPSANVDTQDRCKKFTVQNRNGVGFWEGLMYCVLLWMPVVVVLYLIYIYVIKDIIQPSDPAIGRVLRSQNLTNTSFFHITLSDLGF